MKHQDKHFYIYRIDFEDGHYYIGQRGCKCPIDKDYYTGSGVLCKELQNKGIPFTKTILEIVDDWTQVDNREIFWINGITHSVDPMCLNITLGGGGSKGCHPSEESRRKMSINRSGEKSYMFGKHLSLERRKILSEKTKQRFSDPLEREKLSQIRKEYYKTHDHPTKGKKGLYHPTEEARKKMSETRKGELNGNYGHRWNEEQREHLRQINLGKKLTKEHREKITKGLLARNYCHSEETKKKIRHNKNCRVVCQYTTDNQYISEYFSIGDASRTTNVGRTLISGCCRGKTKTAGGFIWRYAE